MKKLVIFIFTAMTLLTSACEWYHYDHIIETKYVIDIASGIQCQDVKNVTNRLYGRYSSSIGSTEIATLSLSDFKEIAQDKSYYCTAQLVAYKLWLKSQRGEVTIRKSYYLMDTPAIIIYSQSKTHNLAKHKAKSRIIKKKGRVLKIIYGEPITQYAIRTSGKEVAVTFYKPSVTE